MTGSMRLQEIHLGPDDYPVTVELFARSGLFGRLRKPAVWSDVAQTDESLIELPPRSKLGLPLDAIVGVQMTLADGSRMRYLWVPNHGLVGPWFV